MTAPSSPGEQQLKLSARFVRGVAEIAREQWDRLIGDGSPFSEWAFLNACESASATPEHGYLPHHLVLFDEDQRLIAAAPMYIKSDGRAEFIYDYYWYHFAHQIGFDYYPKLVSMAPFTPVTCERFLVDPDYHKATLLKALTAHIESWAFQTGIHGVHFLFVPEAEAELLEPLGYLRRVSFQLTLTNQPYHSFDDYLARFRSKKRVSIKRELRRLHEQQLDLVLLRGDEISEEDIEAMYGFYSLTCRCYGTGSHYLKAPTWKLLWQEWRERMILVLARNTSGQPVVGALLVHKGKELYGRYWGAVEELPSLYFNVSYYRPIQYMIEQGLDRFHCGFGNMGYKQTRGFDPTANLSLHKFADPQLHQLISESLEQERPRVHEQIMHVRQHSKLKK